MCNYSGRLIAWLDGELAEDEMANVHRHVQECIECQSQMDAYEEVSNAFDSYYDTAVASKVRRRVPRWVPVLSAAAAIAAVIAVLLVSWPRGRVEPLVLRSTVTATPPATVVDTVPAPVKTARRRHTISRVSSQNANWLPAETRIQIAIPADAMFPPGALPEGISFIADLSIAADGSAQRLHLQP
jgi:anti-sigma factor RsiW